MIRTLTSALLCIVCWSSTPARFNPQQNQPPLTEVDFRVKGVGLGSSYAVVRRQFRRPISSKREEILDETEICGPSYTSLRLRYDGAVIELHGDLRGRNFEVVEMEVTSPKFLIVPGVTIGMTEAKTRSKLAGEPWQVLTKSGFRILHYVTKGNDGVGLLYFRDGRLVEVYWKYLLC